MTDASRLAGSKSELYPGGVQRIALRARQATDIAQHRCAELMQASERKLRLGLSAHRSRRIRAFDGRV